MHHPHVTLKCAVPLCYITVCSTSMQHYSAVCSTFMLHWSVQYLYVTLKCAIPLCYVEVWIPLCYITVCITCKGGRWPGREHFWSCSRDCHLQITVQGPDKFMVSRIIVVQFVQFVPGTQYMIFDRWLRTHHTSYITHHTSHITHHTSHITHDSLHIPTYGEPLFDPSS